MECRVHTLTEDPEYRHEFGRISHAVWPEFMHHDQKAERYWNLLLTAFPDYQVLLSDEANQVVAVGHSIPLFWDGSIEGLPSGWDEAIEKGALGYQEGIKPNALSALAIAIAPPYQGKGISPQVIRAVKNAAVASGLANLIVPLRPSWKSRYPLASFERYLEWRNDDGLPFDPWLRAHCKLGGKVLAVAPQSMFINGTVSEWERWAGMKFPESGQYVVPGALTPVRIDRENDVGCYVEPNVWVHHEL